MCVAGIVEKDVGLILLPWRSADWVFSIVFGGWCFFFSNVKNLSHLFLFLILQNKLVEEILRVKAE